MPVSTTFAEAFTLDPDVVFLNHGSFGACPRPVQAAQAALRDELEREPVRFFNHRYHDLLDGAREALARFLGANPADLVAVTNATTGVNTVLRSLSFGAGDELLTTDHAYNACRNALDFTAERTGAWVRVARVPFPLAGPRAVVEAVLATVTPRTRLALLDHVTSPTGVIFPVEELARELSARGVEVLVDGAHALGMLPLDLSALAAAGVSYYTGNAHKWLCTPKGAAFLFVRRDRQPAIRPLVVSHGTNQRRPGRSRFHDEFDWPGSHDPTAFLAIPAALEHLGSLLPGGFPELRERNHRLVVAGREILCTALGVEAPCPEAMLGSLATVPLPDHPLAEPPSALLPSPLQRALWDHHRIEVPVFPWPAPPRRWLRVSAQVYNREEDYRYLAAALAERLAAEASRG
jgi:isopenicillin-N epimerase